MSAKLTLYDSIVRAVCAIRTFYSLFLHYVFYGRYRQDYEGASMRTHIHLYSWALVFHIWDKPHYRNGRFVDDMLKNLRNVAIPGTVVPLSFFVGFGKLVVFILFLLAYPILCLGAALIAQKSVIFDFTRRRPKSLTDEMLRVIHSFSHAFCSYLLEPEDWFSLWQLNCRLASFHAWKAPKLEGLQDRQNTKGYDMEDKFLFHEKAEKSGIPVVPTVKLPSESSRLVLKDRNEEGGMGIHFFDLTQGGGPWMCQPAITNSKFVASLLPSNAPLSTFRVITGSRGGGLPACKDKKDVVALSCVFRAGRAGAKTDHSSILFDCAGGVLGNGTTNHHWYIVGLKKLLSKWKDIKLFSFGGEFSTHPDTGKTLKGLSLGYRYEAMQNLCIDAHRTMMPDVPLAGWDVAVTEDIAVLPRQEKNEDDKEDGKSESKESMVLLEANLSCNFFRGVFDKDAYYHLVDEYFELLDKKVGDS